MHFSPVRKTGALGEHSPKLGLKKLSNFNMIDKVSPYKADYSKLLRYDHQFGFEEEKKSNQNSSSEKEIRSEFLLDDDEDYDSSSVGQSTEKS